MLLGGWREISQIPAHCVCEERYRAGLYRRISLRQGRDGDDADGDEDDDNDDHDVTLIWREEKTQAGSQGTRGFDGAVL